MTALEAGPEFSFAIEIARIPPAGGTYDIAASPEQLARLSARLGLLEMKALTGRFVLKVGAGGIVRVTGDIHAEVVQACVVSLAPVPAVLDEAVEASFLDAEAPSRRKADAGEEVVGLDAEEPPEMADGGRIDLGELAVSQLALVLDPYPRAPGVTFDPGKAGLKGSSPETGERAGPFAALAKLKKTKPK